MIKKGVWSKEKERESEKGRGIVGPESNWGLEAGYIGIIRVVMKRRKILKKHATCAATDGRLEVLILAMNVSR